MVRYSNGRVRVLRSCLWPAESIVVVRGVGGMADDWQWMVYHSNPGAEKVPGCIVGGRGPET